MGSLCPYSHETHISFAPTLRVTMQPSGHWLLARDASLLGPPK